MKNMTFSLMLLLSLLHFSLDATTTFGNMETITLESGLLKQSRQLVVFLPADYATSSQQFPVLYLTDGDSHGPHTAGSIDFLAKFEQAPSMIVVGIVNPGPSRTAELALTEQNKLQAGRLSGADLFLRHVEQEVIPLIKSRYRTSAYQALAGTSHGGQFAINALLKRPGLFDGVIAISPSLYWDHQQLLAAAQTALQQQKLSGRLFVSIAQEQPIMTEAWQKFVDLTEQYPSAKLAVASKKFAEESHNSTTLLGVYHGIKHLFHAWAIPDQQQTLADLQAIYQARAKLIGVPMQIPEDRANGYGQWLQYSNRQLEAIELFRWNRQHYPQSFSAHTALVSAYLYFNRKDEAQAALEDAKKSLSNLSAEQQTQLTALFTAPST